MPQYYTTQQVARRLGHNPATLSRSIHENPATALQYALLYGAQSSGDTTYWPAEYFDRRMAELGLEAP